MGVSLPAPRWHISTTGGRSVPTHGHFCAPPPSLLPLPLALLPLALLPLPQATNAKATEMVVRVPKANGRGFELRAVRDDDSAAVRRRARQRVVGWRELSIGEAYVFLGIRLVMGAMWRPQLSDYWHSKFPGCPWWRSR